MNSFEKDVKEIKEKISRKERCSDCGQVKYPDLAINRVPGNTLKRFKDFASIDEFSSDYGFALKYLLDFYLGIIPSGIEDLEQQVEILKNEIDGLKNPTEKKEPSRKNLAGQEIGGTKNGSI